MPPVIAGLSTSFGRIFGKWLTLPFQNRQGDVKEQGAVLLARAASGSL